MYQLIHTPINHFNRLVRVTNPTVRASVQFFCGRRLLPNRGLVITEEEFLANLEDLKSREARGLIRVTTLAGEPVNLSDLSVDTKPVPPAPNPPSQLLVDEVGPERPIPQPNADGSLPFDAALRAMGAEPDVAPSIVVPEEEMSREQTKSRKRR